MYVAIWSQCNPRSSLVPVRIGPLPRRRGSKVEVEDGFCRVRARIPSFDCTYYMVDPPNVFYDADGVVIGEENFDGTAACRQHYQDLVDRDGFAFNTTCYSDPESPGDQNCEVSVVC